jgi:hypothetical protein
MAAQLVGKLLDLFIHSVEGVRERLRAPAHAPRRPDSSLAS